MARKPADQSVHREDIIHAAADVLQRNGYEATTMKDIAAAVNLTAASLYHHFRNKDALLLAVLEAGLAIIIERIEPIVQSQQPPADKLQAMITEHVTGLAGNTAVGAAMVYEIKALMHVAPPKASARPEDHAAYADFVARRNNFFRQRDHFEDLFRCVIQEGIERGEFRPVDAPIFAKTMLGAHNWVGVWYRPQGRLTGDQIAEMMAETFLTALKTSLRG